MCDSPDFAYANSLNIESLDTLFRFVLPSLASHNKLLKDPSHRHREASGMEVKAYRGHDPFLALTERVRLKGPMKVFTSKSCVISIRATPKSLAAVMVNLDTLSQYFAIFLVNYNNVHHKCYDVATHYMSLHEATPKKWNYAVSTEEVKTNCRELGEVALVNWDEFLSIWKVDVEGGPKKRGKVLLGATHLKFVLLCKPGSFDTGRGAVLDVGGMMIPVMENCMTTLVDVNEGSESDDSDEGR